MFSELIVDGINSLCQGFFFLLSCLVKKVHLAPILFETRKRNTKELYPFLQLYPIQNRECRVVNFAGIIGVNK
jgi:hypothetical protein